MVGSEGDLDQKCCMADASGGGIPAWIFALIVIAFLLITILCCWCIWLGVHKTRQPETGSNHLLEQTIELRESFDSHHHSRMDGKLT